MIKQDSKALQLAAASVLDKHAASNAFEALLVCTTYLHVILQDIVLELRSNNASDIEILKSAQLVGTWLGRTGIEARSTSKSET